jgi:hypothetical protein
VALASAAVFLWALAAATTHNGKNFPALTFIQYNCEYGNMSSMFKAGTEAEHPVGIRADGSPPGNGSRNRWQHHKPELSR